MSDPKPESKSVISEKALREVFWHSVFADKPLSKETLRELAVAASADADHFIARHDDQFKLAHEDDDKPFAIVDWR